jgi:hypothetical protein
MCFRTSPNEITRIDRNGHDVRGVADQNWESANGICDVLNSVRDNLLISLTEHHGKRPKAMVCVYRKGQHA